MADGSVDSVCDRILGGRSLTTGAPCLGGPAGGAFSIDDGLRRPCGDGGPSDLVRGSHQLIERLQTLSLGEGGRAGHRGRRSLSAWGCAADAESTQDDGASFEAMEAHVRCADRDDVLEGLSRVKGHLSNQFPLDHGRGRLATTLSPAPSFSHSSFVPNGLASQFGIGELRHALRYSSEHADVAQMMAHAAEQRATEAQRARDVPRRPIVHAHTARSNTTSTAETRVTTLVTRTAADGHPEEGVPSAHPAGGLGHLPEALISELSALRAQQQELLLMHKESKGKLASLFEASQSHPTPLPAVATRKPTSEGPSPHEAQLLTCLQEIKVDNALNSKANQRMVLMSKAISEANAGLRIERQRMEEERAAWRRERSLIAHEAAELKQLRTERQSEQELLAASHASARIVKHMMQQEAAGAPRGNPRPSARRPSSRAPSGSIYGLTSPGNGLEIVGGVTSPSSATPASTGAELVASVTTPQPGRGPNRKILQPKGKPGGSRAVGPGGTLHGHDIHIPPSSSGHRGGDVDSNALHIASSQRSGASAPLPSMNGSVPPSPSIALPHGDGGDLVVQVPPIVRTFATIGVGVSPLRPTSMHAAFTQTMTPPPRTPPQSAATTDAEGGVPQWDGLVMGKSGDGGPQRDSVVGRRVLPSSATPITLIAAAGGPCAAKEGGSGPRRALDEAFPSIPLTPAQEAALLSSGLRCEGGAADGDGEHRAIFGRDALSPFDDLLREARARKRKIRSLYGLLEDDPQDTGDPILQTAVRHLIHDLVAADVRAGTATAGNATNTVGSSQEEVAACLLELLNLDPSAVNGMGGLFYSDLHSPLNFGGGGGGGGGAEGLPHMMNGQRDVSPLDSGMRRAVSSDGGGRSPSPADGEEVMRLLRDIVQAMMVAGPDALPGRTGGGDSPRCQWEAPPVLDDHDALKDVLRAPLRDSLQRDLMGDGHSDGEGRDEEGRGACMGAGRGKEVTVGMTVGVGASATVQMPAAIGGSPQGELTVRVVLESLLPPQPAPCHSEPTVASAAPSVAPLPPVSMVDGQTSPLNGSAEAVDRSMNTSGAALPPPAEVPAVGDGVLSPPPAGPMRLIALEESRMSLRDAMARDWPMVASVEERRAFDANHDEIEEIAMSSSSSSRSSSSSSSSSCSSSSSSSRHRRRRPRVSRRRYSSSSSSASVRTRSTSTGGGPRGRRYPRRGPRRRRDGGRRRSPSGRLARSSSKRSTPTAAVAVSPSALLQALRGAEEEEAAERKIVELTEYGDLVEVFDRYVPRHYGYGALGRGGGRPTGAEALPTVTPRDWSRAQQVVTSTTVMTAVGSPPLAAAPQQQLGVAAHATALPTGAAAVAQWVTGVDGSVPLAPANMSSLASPAVEVGPAGEASPPAGRIPNGRTQQPRCSPSSGSTSMLSSTNPSSYGPGGVHAFYVTDGLRGGPFYSPQDTSSGTGGSSRTTITSIYSSELRRRCPPPPPMQTDGLVDD